MARWSSTLGHLTLLKSCGQSMAVVKSKHLRSYPKLVAAPRSERKSLSKRRRRRRSPLSLSLSPFEREREQQQILPREREEEHTPRTPAEKRGMVSFMAMCESPFETSGVITCESSLSRFQTKRRNSTHKAPSLPPRDHLYKAISRVCSQDFAKALETTSFSCATLLTPLDPHPNAATCVSHSRHLSSRPTTIENSLFLKGSR